MLSPIVLCRQTNIPDRVLNHGQVYHRCTGVKALCRLMDATRHARPPYLAPHVVIEVCHLVILATPHQCSIERRHTLKMLSRLGASQNPPTYTSTSYDGPLYSSSGIIPTLSAGDTAQSPLGSRNYLVPSTRIPFPLEAEGRPQQAW